MVEALLLGLVAFIAQSEYALGTPLISRPIVTGLLTGLGKLGMYRPASLWARRWSWRLSALLPLAPRSRPGRRDRRYSAWRSPLPLAQAQKRRCCLACLSPR